MKDIGAMTLGYANAGANLVRFRVEVDLGLEVCGANM